MAFENDFDLRGGNVIDLRGGGDESSSVSRDVVPRRAVRRARGPHARCWFCTSFEVALPVVYDPISVRYVIMQQEVAPEQKTMHWQMYVEFFDQKRRSYVQNVFKDPAMHCEVRRGSRTVCREYCRKKKTAVPNTQFEWGHWRKDADRKRKLSDMLLEGMSMKEVIEVAPHYFVMYHKGLRLLDAERERDRARLRRDVEVVVYLGPTYTGKTTKATSGLDWFIMPLSSCKTIWFDGYRSESLLIIDDFEGKSQIPYRYLLRLLHGFMLQVPVKGSHVYAFWKKVIITTNVPVKDWYPSRVDIAPLLKRISRVCIFSHVY